jgi:hypothetical protein
MLGENKAKQNFFKATSKYPNEKSERRSGHEK